MCVTIGCLSHTNFLTCPFSGIIPGWVTPGSYTLHALPVACRPTNSAVAAGRGSQVGQLPPGAGRGRCRASKGSKFWGVILLQAYN